MKAKFILSPVFALSLLAGCSNEPPQQDASPQDTISAETLNSLNSTENRPATFSEWSKELNANGIQAFDLHCYLSETIIIESGLGNQENESRRAFYKSKINNGKNTISGIPQETLTEILRGERKKLIDQGPKMQELCVQNYSYEQG